MRRLKTLDVIMSVLIVVLVACVLVPAVGRVQRPVADATCQGNMRMLGRAIDLYTADNNRRYPTNRPLTPSGYEMKINSEVGLSDPGIDPETGLPVRFQYGITWVEGLYPYIRDAAKGTGRSGWPGDYLVCPNASNIGYPNQLFNPSVTYAFNRNLIEYFPPLICNPRNLMMLREIDRLVPSMLRPENNSTGSDAPPPQSAFLTRIDLRIYRYQGETNPNQHSTGSYILFADGHVKYFDVAFYPEPNEFRNKAEHWDPVTAQWYNWYFQEPANPTELKLNRSIAITP